MRLPWNKFSALIFAAALATTGCAADTTAAPEASSEPVATKEAERSSTPAAKELPSGDAVKVGLLHSLSGTMAISEVTVKVPNCSPSTRSTPGAASSARRSSPSSRTGRPTGRRSPRRPRS